MGKFVGTDGRDTIDAADGVGGGPDDLYGYGDNDTLYGLGGDDRLFGGLGADTMYGGAGTGDWAIYIHDPTVGVIVNLETGTGHNGSAEGDRLFDIENLHGTYQGDWLFGNGVPNRIRGAWGNDLLKGGGGSDHLQGDDDNDTLLGGSGGDTLDGGAHIDTAAYDGSPTGVFVSILPGWVIADWGDAAGDTLISIENLTGSAHGDLLFGDDATNVLRGMDGGDTLKGGGGDDRLEGGYGDDTLGGGAGEDTLIGGLGRDTASYSASSTGVHVELGSIALLGDADGDILSGIENVTGSYHFDQLFGDRNANVLTGLNGPDGLYGQGGSDTLWGGEGDDTLYGGADFPGDPAGVDTMIGGIGNDTYHVHHRNDVITERPGEGTDEVQTWVSYTLTTDADVEILRTTNDAGTAEIGLTGNATGNAIRGNNGDNLINGGGGNDELTGRGGQDLFLFDTALDAMWNVDTITDFSVTDDTIWLELTIFSSSLTSGSSVAGSQFVIGTAALDAGDRIIYNNATGVVLYDSDGTGATAAIQFAQLSAGLADPTDPDPLTNFDFFVVA